MLEKVEKELKTEYVPELYEKTMSKLFDDKYYEMSDAEAEKIEKENERNIKFMKTQNVDDSDDEDAKSEDSEEKVSKKELAKSLKN